MRLRAQRKRGLKSSTQRRKRSGRIQSAKFAFVAAEEETNIDQSTSWRLGQSIQQKLAPLDEWWRIANHRALLRSLFGHQFWPPLFRYLLRCLHLERARASDARPSATARRARNEKVPDSDAKRASCGVPPGSASLKHPLSDGMQLRFRNGLVACEYN